MLLEDIGDHTLTATIVYFFKKHTQKYTNKTIFFTLQLKAKEVISRLIFRQLK